MSWEPDEVECAACHKVYDKNQHQHGCPNCGDDQPTLVVSQKPSEAFLDEDLLDEGEGKK